ncbi:formylglycine-generating enzyme family protein [Flammeovirga agarivorans]|uniref:SUMF1/EgtB/PvdO family nonheme iron enzyme n=1 Tax=Flammeovirga agarivorans TaxID=2726742 RepID=A0A7X8XVY3_9BACT|nr:SUMF1/EgtB/PvdO family nonheme iron enzyme [Flammeovirga agarivorans]NLR91772.1 SUMF1/EgtB/PvdO family nonheme iron enzyme [Flammeovirga agarivorans]
MRSSLNINTICIKYLYPIILISFIGNNICIANNISISSVSIGEFDLENEVVEVNFTIQWENSWNDPLVLNNWDAAWVFLKYEYEDNWYHVQLDASQFSITETSGLGTNPTVKLNDDSGSGEALGAFIYGRSEFSGNVNYDVTFYWDYAANGVVDDAELDVQVHAIEMVYVPEGAYYLGSGGTETAHFYKYGSTDPFWVHHKNTTLNIESTTDSLFYDTKASLSGQDGDAVVGTPQTLSKDYPKGVAAFYCMKYEVTQIEYVEFLNTLTTTQATNRIQQFSHYKQSRNNISVIGTNYTTGSPHLPMQRLRWSDNAAYLDWAGLRPMTELEFEKACRGTTLSPTKAANPWGTNTINDTPYYDADNPDDSYVQYEGEDSETIDATVLTSEGNVNYENVSDDAFGPLRVGIYATASSDRVTSGATYYGIMNMGGNMRERVVSAGSSDGRSFTGAHGDGTLSSNGDANVANWPDNDSASGIGLKGTSWFEGGGLIKISNRHSAAKASNVDSNFISARGVRTVE